MERFWNGRVALVTGGTGLLGGWLVKKLIEEGSDVVCLVRDWVPDSIMLAGEMGRFVRIVRGDITDQSCLERTIGEYEVRSVFHLAAQTIVGVANRNPISTFESNIKGTWSVLEACRRSPLVDSIVVASSDKAYGDHDDLPYRESTPLQGRHPYDVSKSCADLISQSYAHTYKMPISITRCANLYGGGDLNWNRLIPGTIRSIYQNEAPIIRSDGKMRRSYMYVEDAVSAYMEIGERVAHDETFWGESFNVSDGTFADVLQVVQTISHLMQSDMSPKIQNLASNEIKDQFLDNTKICSKTKWTHKYSLADGLSETIGWYAKHLSERNCQSRALVGTLPAESHKNVVDSTGSLTHGTHRELSPSQTGLVEFGSVSV